MLFDVTGVSEELLLATFLVDQRVAATFAPLAVHIEWTNPDRKELFLRMGDGTKERMDAVEKYLDSSPLVIRRLGLVLDLADDLSGLSLEVLMVIAGSVVFSALPCAHVQPPPVSPIPEMTRTGRSIDHWCKLAADIRQAKGFVTTKENMLEKLMLCVSELSEAAECVRNQDWGMRVDPTNSKPEGFDVELADCAIRMFDIAGSLGINLEAAISKKMAYNSTRPRLHGKTNPGGA